MAIKTEARWRTCDLKVAAFLLYSNYPVLSYGKEQARVFFEFQDSESRSQQVLAFWNKSQAVEPVQFLDCLSRARDMVTQAMKS